jgi:imidazolonepropionase-like amidohydrolase
MNHIIKIKLNNISDNPNIPVPAAILVQAGLTNREFLMTSFVNIKYSTQHPGVVRAESAFGAVRQLGHAFSGTRGLATLLLSAVAAAVMVVAYQVMDSVTEGHLLVMWIALWAIAFAVAGDFLPAAHAMPPPASKPAWTAGRAAWLKPAPTSASGKPPGMTRA